MSTPTTASAAGPGSFLSALEALRSPANLALVALAAVLALALTALATAGFAAGSIGSTFGLLLMVFAWLVGEAGYCAVTLRQLQVGRGQRPAGIAAAAISGFFAAIKVLLEANKLDKGDATTMYYTGLAYHGLRNSGEQYQKAAVQWLAAALKAFLEV